MRSIKTVGAAAVAAVALAACGSADPDHAGSNVEPREDSAVEEAEPEGEEPESEPVAEEEPEPAPEEPEDEGGWQVETTPYGEAADLAVSEGATGVWSVVVAEPECGVTIELSEYSFLEDAEPQGQWCRVAITATNDADQPLDFWMDTDVAVADWEGRSFTPDSDATIEVNESMYEETQVGQSFEIAAMFDVPDGVELAGVAMTLTWEMGEQEPVVWAD